MKRITIFTLFLALSGIAFGLIAARADEKQPMPPAQTQKTMEAAAQPPQTLANLIADYNAGSNLKERYIAYARKADQEGYKKLAQLFRASAKSLDIHLLFQANNISGLGGTPKADIKGVMVKSTQENLAAAIRSEAGDTEMTYPGYLDQAKSDNLKMPTIAFTSGSKIEVNRKDLLLEAQKDLKSWKKSAKNGFYVCTICGNLTANLNFKTCAVCGASVSQFEQVK